MYVDECHPSMAVHSLISPVPIISAHPSLQELEAARPDNGKKLPKARETRDYWYKFVAATQTHTEDQIRAVYDMAKSVAHMEINRANRIVVRLREIEQIERNGESIPQTYKPAPTLLPGQQIYVSAAPPSRRSLIVVLKINRKAKNRIPTTTSLLSVRMKTTLSRLRHESEEYPRYPPPLANLTARFEPPIECADQTDRERQCFATCESDDTLTGYQTWCETLGAEITRQNPAKRISSCLVQIIRRWREDVLEAEEAGADELEETFLQAVMRGLGDLEEVEREVAEEELRYDVWARDVEC